MPAEDYNIESALGIQYVDFVDENGDEHLITEIQYKKDFDGNPLTEFHLLDGRVFGLRVHMKKPGKQIWIEPETNIKNE